MDNLLYNKGYHALAGGENSIYLGNAGESFFA
jgi:hypothetical protein